MKSINFEKKTYWNSRYASEDVFEWFHGFSAFKHLIEPHIHNEDAILMLGCGNSDLSFDMHQCGYKNIVNVDYSEVCIHHMANKYKQFHSLKWLTMDIRELTFDHASFDTVIEKGTLDSLLVSEKDRWHISEKTYAMLENILWGIRRILKPGGKFISITYEQPHFRKRIYARTCYGWNIECYNFGEAGCFEYFVYVMTCGQNLDQDNKEFERISMEQRGHWLSSAMKVQSHNGDECRENEDFLQKIDL